MYQRYELHIDFHDTLNILHGQNGTGKSTLIHILANIANRDLLRFAYLEFSKITVGYSNGVVIYIERRDDDQNYIITKKDSAEALAFSKAEAIRSISILEEDRAKEDQIDLIVEQKIFIQKANIPKLKAAYFPAFRTMLEAWAGQFDEEMRRYRTRATYGSSIPTYKVTSFARELFGKFLPAINYPSPLSIEQNLREEIRDAQLKIARYESSLFSESFVKVFSSLLERAEGNAQEAEHLLEEISDLTTETALNRLSNFEGPSNAYVQLQMLVGKSRESRELASSATGALKVYRDALKERRNFQAEIFSQINKYFDAVNAFLDQKELKYSIDPTKRTPRVGLMFGDGTWSSIRVMSSGERQLLTMLYAVTKMSEDSLVLIDEPELSLHIDWQEELLRKMMAQLGERQIIVCTHSPSIASNYEDYMIEVSPKFTDQKFTSEESPEDDEEFI